MTTKTAADVSAELMLLSPYVLSLSAEAIIKRHDADKDAEIERLNGLVDRNNDNANFWWIECLRAKGLSIPSPRSSDKEQDARITEMVDYKTENERLKQQLAEATKTEEGGD